MTENGTIVVKIRKPGRLFKKKQGFSFDMYCYCYMSSYTQLGFDEVAERLGERFVDVLYYCAAYSYNKNVGKKAKFTELDVKFWIDNMPQRIAKQISDTWLNSQMGGHTLKEYVEMAKEQQSGEKKN